MTPPPVWIILLNYNGHADTLACLESVAQLDYSNRRVVICDNGSRPDSIEALRTWGRTRGMIEYDRENAERGGDAALDRAYTLIHTGGNLGFPGGNNVALRYLLARNAGGYVWLLNNDTIVAPSSLTALVNAALEAKPAVVGSTILEHSAPDIIQAAAGGQLSWNGFVDNLGQGLPRTSASACPGRLDYICGCSLLAPVDAFRQIGLLDERFFIYAEDSDWSMRAAASGYRLVHAPDSELWHKGSATTVAASPFNDYHNVRSTLLFLRKHWPLRYALALVVSTYRWMLPKLIRRQWARLAAVGRAYRDVLVRA